MAWIYEMVAEMKNKKKFDCDHLGIYKNSNIFDWKGKESNLILHSRWKILKIFHLFPAHLGEQNPNNWAREAGHGHREEPQLGENPNAPLSKWTSSIMVCVKFS